MTHVVSATEPPHNSLPTTMPAMSSWRAFCHTAHLTALGLWAGAITTSAATAAVAFPTLKALETRIGGLAPGFESDHYRFAAGAVAQRVFTIADIVAFACAMVAATTLLLLVAVFKIPPRRPATILRSMALAIAVASLAAMLLIVTPQINKASELHYAAAKAGDAPAAAQHKKAVDDLHPLASKLLMAEVVGVLVSLVVGAWSLASAAPPERLPSGTANPYPEPELLRRRPS